VNGTSILTAFLDAHPAAPALFDRDRPVTYAALADEAARLATGLRSLGVGAGDRVALWLPNLPAWLTTFFACGRLGAIAVAVNTRFRGHEVQDIVSRAGCKALVFWPGFRHIDFAGILAECDPAALGGLTHAVAYAEGDERIPEHVHGKPVIAYRVLVEGGPLREGAGRPESGCVLFTTSGTTKAPKFVLHDQRTVLRHARDVARAFGYQAPDTRVLVTTPPTMLRNR
jgi:fatty-acyl-CoA synthase